MRVFRGQPGVALAVSSIGHSVADRSARLGAKPDPVVEGMWVELPEGRRLGYAEYGDPRGKPVFYFHGLPGSRLEARLLAPAAAALGIRLIAVDRPGYGRSDPQPARRLADWPGDVAALADALAIDRFYLIGVSGGGPYALACACDLAPRVRAAAVVCGLGPVGEAALRRSMRGLARIGVTLASRWPATLAPLLGGPFHLLVEGSPQWVLKLIAWAGSRPDRAVLARPEVRAILGASLREAFRQGSGGAVADLVAAVADWRLTDGAPPVPVRFWHGAADAVVPLEHSRVLAARLAGARLQVLAREGHYSLPILCGHRILRDLLEAPAADEGEAARRLAPL